MKLGELYVHIYYFTLNNIFYIKLLCMHDAKPPSKVSKFENLSDHTKPAQFVAMCKANKNVNL